VGAHAGGIYLVKSRNFEMNLLPLSGQNKQIKPKSKKKFFRKIPMAKNKTW